MGLTKVSTDGVKDDAITSGKIPADAIGQSELANNAVDSNAITSLAVTANKIAAGEITNTHIGTGAINGDRLTDETVTLAKLPHGTSSNNGKFLRANNGADPTFETVNTDLVSDTSPQLGGDLDSNGHDISVNSALIEIRHSSCHLDFMENGTTNHRLRNGSGNFQIQKLSDDKNTSTTQFLVDGGTGAVELYHNGTKQCETSANGLAFVSGKGIDFSAISDGSRSIETNGNVLDDYEEGSWTPVFQNNDQGGTFPIATYVRVGRLVSISFHATVGGGSDSSGFKITGLPYNPDKNGVAPVATNCNIACFARVYDSQDKMEVHKFDDNDITYANLSDKFIMINATYRCNP